VKDLAEKVKGYGVPAVTVDGNDVIAVYEATKYAVDRARAGKGVHFVEVKTYRRKGHAEHDDQHYVPPVELEEWAKNDPVDRFVARLLEAGWAAEQDFKDIDDDVKDEIDRATDACVNEPLPPPDSALDAVYAQPARADRLWFRSV
ncbi:MAG TPA: thiamine pyrophosphate-dependent enzyme, partial [Gemmatimonadales bacterium]|nr:thiamine pyrophosphate-dependent enzyme [Gemmatimonadales bacterium]